MYSGCVSIKRCVKQRSHVPLHSFCVAFCVWYCRTKRWVSGFLGTSRASSPTGAARERARPWGTNGGWTPEECVILPVGLSWYEPIRKREESRVSVLGEEETLKRLHQTPAVSQTAKHTMGPPVTTKYDPPSAIHFTATWTAIPWWFSNTSDGQE
jgi:hypothetical protein